MDHNIIEKIVLESIDKVLLQERLSSVIYHFMSLPSAIGMLKDNTFYLQSEYSGEGADEYNGKYPFYMSFTRQRDRRLGYSATRPVRVSFDGDMLNSQFKGKAIQYWDKGKNDEWRMGKYHYMTNPTKKMDGTLKYDQFQRRTENEDRLFSREPQIFQISKYIKRIDVLCEKNEKELVFVKALIKEASRLRISKKVHTYTNEEDFNKMNSNEISLDEIWQSEGQYNYEAEFDFHSNEPSYASNIAKILDFILTVGDVKYNDRLQEAAKILRHYGLEKYIRPTIEELKSRTVLYMDNRMNPNEEIAELHNNMKDKSVYAKAVKMVRDFLHAHGYGSVREAIAKYSELTRNRNRYGDSTFIDFNKKLPFLVHTDLHDHKTLVTDFNAPFVDVMRRVCNYDAKYYFIDDVSYGIQSYRNNDEEKFKKYLQHLLKSNISMKDMLDVLNRMDIDKEYVRENILYGDFEWKELNYNDTYNYSLESYDDREKIEKMFVKNDKVKMDKGREKFFKKIR